MTDSNIPADDENVDDDTEMRLSLHYTPDGTYTLGRATGHKPYVFIEVDSDDDEIVFNVEFGGGVPADLEQLAQVFEGLISMIQDEDVQIAWAAKMTEPEVQENEPVSADDEDEEQA